MTSKHSIIRCPRSPLLVPSIAEILTLRDTSSGVEAVETSTVGRGRHRDHGPLRGELHDGVKCKENNLKARILIPFPVQYSV